MAVNTFNLSYILTSKTDGLPEVHFFQMLKHCALSLRLCRYSMSDSGSIFQENSFIVAWFFQKTVFFNNTLLSGSQYDYRLDAERFPPTPSHVVQC
jgi:hypothetical protein